MISFEGKSASKLWEDAFVHIQSHGQIQSGREQRTRELIHVAFTLTNSRNRIVFSRAINPAFAIAEVIWILSGANDASFLQFWNPRMKSFLDEGKRHQHGAYGYRLGINPRLSQSAARALRHENGERASTRIDQLRAALDALIDAPHTRQAVLQIWSAELDLPNPIPRSRDVPCNLCSHVMIRDDKLEWLQVMRSNDLIWGTPYNFVQFTCMQEILAGWLGVDVGNYCHISDSLHIYERHWSEKAIANDTVSQGFEDLRLGPYGKWEDMWRELVDLTLAMTTEAGLPSLKEISHHFDSFPRGYKQWLYLLLAESMRRAGHLGEATEYSTMAGDYLAHSFAIWLGKGAKPK